MSSYILIYTEDFSYIIMMSNKIAANRMIENMIRIRFVLLSF